MDSPVEERTVKRILLVAPPFYRLMGSHFNGLHLGIAYIASVLKEHGHCVRIYNADYQDSSSYADQRQLLDSFPTYKAILDDVSHPIWSEVVDRIANFAPDILGITMLTPNYKAAQNIAELSKSRDANLKVVVGGVHPSLDPEGTLAQDCFDYVIRGEGEFSLLELVEGHDEKDIPGLSYKKGGRSIHNQARPLIDDLDILPFPCRDRGSFIGGTGYLETGYIMTGRGCPFSCSYCASPLLWGRVVRYRSVSNVISELEWLAGNSDSMVRFVDDAFNLNKQRTKEICRQIFSRGLKHEWVCDARVDLLDEELVSLMVQAGCVRIKLGVESGSNRILEKVGKGFTTETVRQQVVMVKKYKLPLTVYLMAGFPGETTEDLRQTIELAKELDADYYSLSIFTPYYGTQIWNEMYQSGQKMDKEHWEYFYHQSQEMVVNDNLDPKIVSEFLDLNEREGKARI